MNTSIYSPLQIREVFHLEFLRWLSRKLEAGHYALKGGVNLRLFFKSFRYSGDMDIDIAGPRVERVTKTAMEILMTRGFTDSLKSFGIERVVAPDMTKAKQTETTQRFKIHLLTTAGENLFTKIEFSRRGFKGSLVAELVSSAVLRAYKMVSFIIPHYDASSAVTQKIQALAGRTAIEARDIFDLFILSSQYEPKRNKIEVSRTTFKAAHDNIFLIGFTQFRDQVVAYLALEEQKTYSAPEAWDEIKLKVAHFLEEFGYENK
jgi:hypothetical protein